MPTRPFLPAFARQFAPPVGLLASVLLCGCVGPAMTSRPTGPLDNMSAGPRPEPGAGAGAGAPRAGGLPGTAGAAPAAGTSGAYSGRAPLPPPLDTHAVVVSPVNISAAPATNIPQRPTNLSVLAYADKVRALPPAELQQEIARLSDMSDPARQPADDLQLAMALGHTRVPADLVRAQGLLQRVLANPQEDVRMLHPLARLLSARYAEQKRVEDLLDKQNQQMRDSQRRIDQLNDRLEAMRAIERSLTSRTTPGTTPHTGAGGAGGSGLRPPPPPTP